MNKKLMILTFIISLTSVLVPQQLSLTGETKKIIDSNGEVFMNPSYSPDGSMIAFTSRSYNGIYIYSLSSREIIKISDDASAGFSFKWSTDSKSILSRVARYEGIRRYNAVKIFDIENGFSKLLSDYRTQMPFLPEWADGDSKVILPTKSGFELFESGKEKIPYSSNPDIGVFIKNDKIGTVTLSSSDEKSFEPIKGMQAINLAISPDRSKIAFEIVGGNMFVMNLSTLELTDLGVGHRPDWSPDSKYIVYMITEDDGHNITASDIYVTDLTGVLKTNLTNSPQEIEMNPSFSPDGKKIVFDLLNDGSIYQIEIE